MPYRCHNPGSYKGKVVGNGQCVILVQKACGVPHTSRWKEGVKVRGGNVEKGTAIATFENGVYPNRSSGNHAAIFIEETPNGILVWDQWVGRKVGQRLIQFKGGVGSASNDGDAFSVIE
ncbi:MAG: BPSL0067 family protein [Acidobacteriota bacterium]|nr:BPSL0067 family protein [Acidobacteriota bacterium]